MSIREATLEDVPDLVRMGLHFLRSSIYAEQLRENPQKMEATVSSIITGKMKGRVFIAENGHPVGMFVLALFPHHLSDDLIAAEVAWWVEPEARGKVGLQLLEKAKAAAVEMKADWMQLVSPSERTDKLYERLGYTQIERAYQRRLP